MIIIVPKSTKSFSGGQQEGHVSVRRIPLFLLQIICMILIVGGISAQAVQSGSAVVVGVADLKVMATGSSPFVGPEIVISEIDNEQYFPAAAYNANHQEYLVVWHNLWGNGSRDIYAQRITESGELLSWFAVASGPNSRAQPSVAYDPVNDRYLVVWAYDLLGNGSNWDLYGRFIPWDGPDAGLVEFPISSWPSNQWEPIVTYARAQEEFLVVWTNTPVSTPAYVSGRRIFADGSGFPPGDGFTIASDLVENRVNPAVAYNLARNEFLVTYDDGLDIHATRLTGEGLMLGGGEFGIASWPDTESHPAVAACRNADQYLVAWQSLVGASNYDVYARYVTGDGSLDGGPLVVEDTTVSEIEPAVGCNEAGNKYLLAWQQQYSSAVGPYGIWGRMAFADKTMGPASGIFAPVAGATMEGMKPAVAGGLANYLVSWEHLRDGTSYRDIHGALISPHSLFLPTLRRAFP
jgi:hypothetical protein